MPIKIIWAIYPALIPNVCMKAVGYISVPAATSLLILQVFVGAVYENTVHSVYIV